MRARVAGEPPRSSRCVLITGGGRGIGRATARAFAARGYSVAIAELSAEAGRATARALVRAGSSAVFVPTDVGRPLSVERSVRATIRRFGRVDCLVNNAGVVRPGRLHALSARDVRRMIAVNLEGPLLMTRAVLPLMLRQRAGAIVNVASQLGKSGLGEYVTYCATKFGVVGLTEALADELSGTDVRVWAVCPGLVDTRIARQAGVVSPRERARLLRPETVAEAIVNLATGRRRAASGAAVDVVR